MAKDFSTTLGELLDEAARDSRPAPPRRGPLSGMRGVAVGAGLAAVAPIAVRAASGPVKRKLMKAAVKHAAKKPADALRGLAGMG